MLLGFFSLYVSSLLILYDGASVESLILPISVIGILVIKSFNFFVVLILIFSMCLYVFWLWGCVLGLGKIYFHFIRGKFWIFLYVLRVLSMFVAALGLWNFINQLM